MKIHPKEASFLVAYKCRLQVDSLLTNRRTFIMGRHHIADNTHPEGSAVWAKERPAIALVVRRYVDRIYYCTNQSDPLEKERVYFERELLPPKMSK